MGEVLTKGLAKEVGCKQDANYGWLDTYHTFSFFRYHNPGRMNFGLLRVLNDDVVAPGAGFETHPHDNMEIVSIPLHGALEHKDSAGHVEVINTNDVQIMSAGSGLTHSEYNHSKKDKVNFLQIWILPKEQNIEPIYDQKTFLPENRNNKIQTIVSPEKKNGILWINQDAYFSRVDLSRGNEIEYELRKKDNGLYIFLIEGEIEIDSENLIKRDAIGLTKIEKISIKANKEAHVLLIEVPIEI